MTDKTNNEDKKRKRKWSKISGGLGVLSTANGKQADTAPSSEIFRTFGSEAALIGRAVRARWPIREEVRSALADKLSRVAIDPDSPARTSIAAARVLMAADALNQTQEMNTPESVENPIKLSERVAALKQRLRDIADSQKTASN